MISGRKRPDNELYPQLKRSTVPAVLRFFAFERLADGGPGDTA